MKKFTTSAATFVLLLWTSNAVFSQANRNLNNLLSPTAVNQHLLPNTNCSKDLGSVTKKWRYLYLCSRAGINTNPAYPLDINNTNYNRAINVFSPNTGELIDRIGVYSNSRIADGYGYGVYGIGGYRGVYGSGNGGTYTGSVIGVYGNASGTTGNRYGVYGSASGGTFNAAGYFPGQVWASSYHIISDRKVKTNLAPVTNLLERLMKLKPSTFEYKSGEYKNWGLTKGKQFGFIADEVKQVFPELVEEAVHPAEFGEDKTIVLHPEEKYEGINLVGLIPVTIASVQEQQKLIEEHKKMIDDLKAENEELKSRLMSIEQAIARSGRTSIIRISDARLDQNAPNPFNKNTMINYFIPQKASMAVMEISGMDGKVMKTMALAGRGKGQLILEAGQLSAGTYQYSLIVDGKLLDTKKMVLTR
jgi:hypothetical protein